MIINKYKWMGVSIFSVYLVLLFLLLPASITSGYYTFYGTITGNVTVSDPDSLAYRVLLIGDAGEQSGSHHREPVLNEIEFIASEIPERTSVIFLGDNIYPAGLPDTSDRDYTKYAGFLDAQIDVARSNANIVFVPGNHDWGHGSSDGWQRIKRQTKYINDKNLNNLTLMPGNGCPGPVFDDYNDLLRIIYIDSQWFLHSHEKPEGRNSGCNISSEQEFYSELKSILDTSNGKYVLIAAHHPLITFGTHGGFFPWTAHLFPFIELNELLWIPLPVIGSLYPLARNMGISNQDISGNRYRSFINNMQSILSDYDNILYASGHEHSLQVIEGAGGNYYLVSGFGTSTHNSFLSVGDGLLFGAIVPGFIQMDFYENGTVLMLVYAVSDDETPREIIFRMTIEKSESSIAKSLTDE